MSDSTPNSIIERAARAMYANVAPEWSWDDPEAELLRTMYRDNVRVALDALRMPTVGMCAAVSAAARGGAGAAAIFRAGVDAALAEPA